MLLREGACRPGKLPGPWPFPCANSRDRRGPWPPGGVPGAGPRRLPPRRAWRRPIGTRVAFSSHRHSGAQALAWRPPHVSSAPRAASPLLRPRHGTRRLIMPFPTFSPTARRAASAHAPGAAPRPSLPVARGAVREASDVLLSLGSSPDGLTRLDALFRLDKEGPNEVARDRPPRWHVQLLH